MEAAQCETHIGTLHCRCSDGLYINPPCCLARCRSVLALQEDKRRLEAHTAQLQRSLQVRQQGVAFFWPFTC